MSGGIAPSKSTVYVSNLPFSLTNNDLHKIFEKHGKVVKVTVMKDKVTRKSRGVAFILFLKREDAHVCAKALNGCEMFGRKLKCNLANDNGRSTEFIRRRTYPDKSRCYECGDEGHLSYKCPKNALGEREPPPKKERKRKKGNQPREQQPAYHVYDSDDNSWREDKEPESEEEYEPDLETLSAAIQMEQQLHATNDEAEDEKPKKRIRPSSYFSDEEDVSD